MSRDIVPELPASAPRTGNALGRCLGRFVLRLGGWRVRGEFPDLAHLVVIAAPHSSAWDAVWGLAVKLALGLRITFIAKQELFRWPLGPLLAAFGGVPVDRSAGKGLVQQMAMHIRSRPACWVVLAPEGTRKRVERWKTGFWHIAKAAQTPVLCASFHYPEKIIGIGPLVHLSNHLENDMRRLREFYATMPRRA